MAREVIESTTAILPQPLPEPKTTKKGLSIKENLSNFQLPGIPGPLSWGFLSPFLLKEHCLVQYKARIPKKRSKYSTTHIGEIAISLKRLRLAIMVVA